MAVLHNGNEPEPKLRFCVHFSRQKDNTQALKILQDRLPRPSLLQPSGTRSSITFSSQGRRANLRWRQSASPVDFESPTVITVVTKAA